MAWEWSGSCLGYGWCGWKVLGLGLVWGWSESGMHLKLSSHTSHLPGDGWCDWKVLGAPQASLAPQATMVRELSGKWLVRQESFRCSHPRPLLDHSWSTPGALLEPGRHGRPGKPRTPGKFGKPREAREAWEAWEALGSAYHGHYISTDGTLYWRLSWPFVVLGPYTGADHCH